MTADAAQILRDLLSRVSRDAAGYRVLSAPREASEVAELLSDVAGALAFALRIEADEDAKERAAMVGRSVAAEERQAAALERIAFAAECDLRVAGALELLEGRKVGR